jgi:hypothetical protein
MITDDAHLAAAVRYIHRNPLDLHGIARVSDYRWSSHRTYLGLRQSPPWLFTDHVFAGWTATEIDRFVEQPLDSSLAPGLDVIAELVVTIELVLAERGISAERRSGAVARQIALEWFADQMTTPDIALMEAFRIERRGTLRTAISRARMLLRSEPEMREVQLRAVGLLAVSPITSRV